MSMLHQQITFQANLYEDEFPSLSETRSKDSGNINLSSTPDSSSYCDKLKMTQDEKVKSNQNERGVCNDGSYCKEVVSKSIKTHEQDLETSSHFYFGHEKFSGKLTGNNPVKIKDPRLINFNPATDRELAPFSNQSDEQEKGWIVVKKKLPHGQAEENKKISNKTKIERKTFLKNQTSVANVSLPKHRVQNVHCTSKKKYVSDSDISSINKQPSSQNKVAISDKKYTISNNNSRHFKFQHASESGKMFDFNRVEVPHMPKQTEDSNKQSKNNFSDKNYFHAVKTIDKQNVLAKEKHSSQNEKQYSTNISHKEKFSSSNKTPQQSFETRSKLNKQKATNSYPENKTENCKNNTYKKEFKVFPNQNKKDLNKSFSGNIFDRKHAVESKKNSNVPIPGSSKKKRKSKIKRQVAMQSDKIRIITPEVYSKIMNVCNDEKLAPPKNITVNIFDSNEYPELGSSSIPVLKSEKVIDGYEISKTDTPKKFNSTAEKSAIDFRTIGPIEENFDCSKDHGVSAESNFFEGECSELKKLPVHHNNPITISLFDMLLVNKPKKRDAEKAKEFPGNLLASKFSLKKQSLSGHHPIVNPLDSSKPAVKRGKEREKPKPKRLSRFKKIILSDREKRKEQILKQQNWNKLYEEIDEFSYKESNEKTNEKEFMKKTESNLSDVDLQHSSHINSRDELVINGGYKNLPVHTKLLNLYSSFGNSTSEYDPYTNINDTKNDFLEENSIFKPKSLCTELTGIITNPTCDFVSQTHSNNTELKERESETKENKLYNICKTEVQNLAIKELERGGESNAFSTTVPNHFFNSSLINQTESNKREDISIISNSSIYFNKKLEASSFESSLTGVQNQLKNNNASKMFSEEERFDDILCDIQNLFLLEGDINIFPHTEISTKVHSNFTNDENIKEISNNFYILSTADDMHVEENIGKDCSLIETVYSENTGKICKYEKCDLPTACICEKGNIYEKRFNQEFHRIYSDKEILQAAYFVLHSKKFRDYCTHFSNKILEETVFALLDDLTRFQDRMHQKDPIKARMKRRLIYGIKEIKRHIKLKKLKCIIIATDIEDSKTEGGLNDIINELKTLAKDYHVSCVFSHPRKKLGHICHKPSPVSAVGVLNYEGSEVNFKKILELQNECKIDYDKILKSLVFKLSDVQVELLHTTKAKDPAHLCHVVINLLKEIYPQSSNNQNIEDLSLSDEAPVSQENQKSKINKDTIEIIEINNILVKYKFIN